MIKLYKMEKGSLEPVSKLVETFQYLEHKATFGDAFVCFSTVPAALSNEANELLPIFNKTTSKFYKTSMPTGDWSNQATTSLNGLQLNTHHKKQLLPHGVEKEISVM